MRSLISALLLVTACSPGPDVAPSSEVQPNVLLVSVDTLRADHLASYGYERDTAPTLTMLAEQGAQFEQSFSQASTTTPSHASMFTGRLPSQHGLFVYWRSLSDEEVTLAELFGQHGYATFAAVSSERFDPDTGFGQGFQVYETCYDLAKNERGARVAEVVLECARQAGSTPWFGFVHLFEPHAPYDHPEPHQTRWHPGCEELVPSETIRYIAEHSSPTVEVPEHILDCLRGAYDGGIGFADSHVRRMLDELPGDGRPLLVVVTSDHGEAFKEHGHLGHSMNLHEELVRVPLIVRYEGVVPAGMRIEEPVQNADLFPTIAELARLPVPDGLAGRSFAGRLRGGEDELAQPYEGYRDVVVMQRNRQNWAAAATFEGGRFKLMKNRGNPKFQMFRLDDHPHAGQDVLALYHEERRSLVQLAETLQLDAPTTLPSRREMTDEQVEGFKEMGYAGESDED